MLTWIISRRGQSINKLIPNISPKIVRPRRGMVEQEAGGTSGKVRDVWCGESFLPALTE